MTILPQPVTASRSRRLRTHVPKLSALAALLFGAVAGYGQFNGPASTSGAEINRPVSVTTDQALLFPPSHEQQLQPGDVLAITVFGQSEYKPTVRLATDYTVQLPLIGVISLRGLNISQAETFIAQRLVTAGMYVDPQVNIQVTEGPNASVTVIGEAHGVIPVSGSRRLLDVLSAAGGLPITASHVVTINRPDAPQPLVIDLGSDPQHSALANIPVFPGDTIVVARIGVVYILGAFKTDGAIPLTPYSPLTLTQAASLSGGVTFDGKLTDLSLIRTIGDKRQVVKLDVGAIFKGKAPDPILQPNDIVYLPSSVVKVAIEQGGIGAIIGAASLAFTAVAISRQ